MLILAPTGRLTAVPFTDMVTPSGVDAVRETVVPPPAAVGAGSSLSFLHPVFNRSAAERVNMLRVRMGRMSFNKPVKIVCGPTSDG